MESILDWGIEVILWLQQFHPALDVIFEAITLAGSEYFFLIGLPVFYWCLDRHLGARMLMLSLVSLYSNECAKVLFDQPRPAEYDSRVWCYTHKKTEGRFPSGHTQFTTVIWSYLAIQLRRRWLWILAGVMMVLVPLSRVYLGIHFPHDLLGGYLIGVGLLWAFIRLTPALEQFLKTRKLQERVMIFTMLPILTALILRTESGVAASATLMGASVGLILERRWVRFTTQGSWVQRGLRYATGLLVLVVIWAGLRAAFASLEPVLLFRYIRYSLAGIWATLGAPWIFLKLGLVTTDK